MSVRIQVDGPWFEDLKAGQVFSGPPVTLTDGLATLYSSATGDRLRLPLDRELSRSVTGVDHALAHPGLVIQVAIGGSTEVTQRVRGNLFYRGLVLRRPVFIGDTLRTRTEVVGLRENARKPGKPATGLAALRITTVDQTGAPVLDFWRCPMLPLRDPASRTGHADDFAEIPDDLDDDALAGAIPDEWRLDRFARANPAPRAADIAAGTTFEIGAHDTVTGAAELVRATLNMAASHVDAGASPYGQRLVYGGHTIAIAGAQAVRAIPSIVTILAWRSCDHIGPVFEHDRLRTELDVEGVARTGEGAWTVDLRARTFAARDTDEQVLDWRFVALMA